MTFDFIFRGNKMRSAFFGSNRKDRSLAFRNSSEFYGMSVITAVFAAETLRWGRGVGKMNCGWSIRACDTALGGQAVLPLPKSVQLKSPPGIYSRALVGSDRSPLGICLT